MKPKSRTVRRRAAVCTAIGAAGSLLLLSAGTAAASANGPGSSRPGRTAVPQGIGAAALDGARAVGKASAATIEHVSFVLKTPLPGRLAIRVNSGGSHLTVAQFASLFGQPSAKIAQLTSYLTANGIHSTVDANHLDIQTTGTVAAYNQALGITQSTFQTPAVRASGLRHARAAVTFHGTTQQTTLPSTVAPIVLSILGLTNYPTGFNNAVRVPHLAKGIKPAVTRNGTGTPGSFTSMYNLNPVLRTGHTGQGQTIGIVTLASFRPNDANHFWADTLKIKTKANRIGVFNVDGGAGAVSLDAGSAETTLDVEQSGAVAPNASIVVYQAPNTDAGFIDAFSLAASQNRASAVSTSWGESETDIASTVAQQKESGTFAQAFNEMFEELAAQGQSTFAAAGDSGAYDASADLGTTNLSVDEPASSPWITAAGGTTLNGTINVAQGVSVTIGHQRAWGWDWLWPKWQQLGADSELDFIVADQNVAGGGGGYSTVAAAPGYQTKWLNPGKYSAVQYLTPTDFTTQTGLNLPLQWTLNATPAVTTGTSGGRAVPDLSADADPFTGYEEYFTGFVGNPLETGWGGTSFVAPQLAGAAAVLNSFAGHRIGFWNPWIYQFAAGKGSPFTPLASPGTGNDNLFFTGTAGDVYNPATGLGIPNLSALGNKFKAANA